MFRRAHIMWNALGAKALVPANRNWHFQPIVMNEFYYGKYVFVLKINLWENAPTLREISNIKKTKNLQK